VLRLGVAHSKYFFKVLRGGVALWDFFFKVLQGETICINGILYFSKVESKMLEKFGLDFFSDGEV